MIDAARRVPSLLLVALVVALGAGLVRPSPAAGEFCGPYMPKQAADVRGDTFRATVTAVTSAGDAPPLVTVHLLVTSTYARAEGSPAGQAVILHVPSNPCDGFALLGLQTGDDILMSTASLGRGDGPATWNTAVWRMLGGRPTLLVLEHEDGTQAWFTDDRRLEQVRSIGDALALVAPAAVRVRDTAGEQDAGRGLAVLLLTALALLLVGGVVVRQSLARRG